MNKRLLLSFLSLIFSVAVWAQSPPGELSGQLVDSETGEPLMFANVIVESNGVQKGGAQTDLEGNYTIKPLDAGTYTVKASFVGYQTKVINGVVVNASTITRLDIQLSGGVQLEELIIIDYEEPLIEVDKTTGGESLTREEIKQMPTRNINTQISVAGGVYSKDGGTPNIKGARSNATEYYVDGIKVSGRLAVPQGAIEQLQVITGGVPAEYGDALGGIVSITTRGPSTRYGGGLEVITSQFLTPYNYNLLEGNVSGPILWRDQDKERDSALLGFFFAGNVNHVKDGDPSAIGIWQLEDEMLENLRENPLVPAEAGGYVAAAEYLTKDDLVNVKVKPNVEDLSVNLSGKLDFSPVDNVNISAGGQFGYSNDNEYIYSYSLLNSNNNPQRIDYNYRGYLRFSQTFETDENSIVKNPYYTIQANYSKRNYTRQDESHQDDVFRYGYLGSFDIYRTPIYMRDTVYYGGTRLYTNVLQGYLDTLVTFDPAGVNPTTEQYTENFFELRENQVTSLTDVVANRALRNGDAPQIVYSLWYNSGAQWPYYQKLEQDLFSLFATASGTVEDHAIKFGVQYEQQVQRYYSLNSTALWTRMRQLANLHLGQFDTENPIPVFDDQGFFLDTVNYDRLDESFQNPEAQPTFDANFRQYLIDKGATDVYGNPITSTSLINIDRYSPEDFSLDMFSADDLYGGGGASLVTYYGYDHTGDKITGRPSIEDFLESDDRLLAPYNPIYVAGFIEDKFTFRDLIFRLGLRVDRFDANQPVLEDRYSLYPIKTVSESAEQDGLTHVNTAGADWKVYVNDLNTPNPRVVGYRDGDTWYDATGAEINDPDVLANQTTSGTITPLLVNEDNQELSAASFKDYQPQVNWMPRIAFSFPISDVATFFANYDVLTQRPRDYNIGTLDDYLFLAQRATLRINNPALRPERRTNYELGFKQRLTRNTAITLQAFYGQIRDMVQVVRVIQAYPVEYITYGNIDFGTVKGFTVKYDLRRLPQTNVQLNLNYTLQFADGTGSSATSGANFANVGQPNLRIPVPLSYDVRHTLTAVLDYRYAEGADYNGPVLGDKQILKNTGANLLLNARSGEPFTAQGNVTQEAAIGVAQRASLAGNINGLRLPWQFRLDLKIDRDFELKFGRDEEEGRPAYTRSYLNVYVWISNLLDSRNIVNVYNYTGLPDDDGYLTSSVGRAQAAASTDPQAFYDQYSIKANNPDFYTQPRVIRLGVSLNF